MKSREYWLDYLRAYACILVTFGHLLMSLLEANIIQSEFAAPTFVELIYCFHVYIFFFCSGYLFQNKNENSSLTSKQYIYQIEKCVNFLIVYVVFSGFTYAIKVVFSAEVNTSATHSFLDTLLQYPINQMWYMYAISVIYLAAKKIHSGKSACTLLLAALIVKNIVHVPGISPVIFVPLNYLFQNMIWFVIGQIFAYRKIRLSMKPSLLFAFLFAALFTLKSVFHLSSGILTASLTLLGILASAGIIYCLTKAKTRIQGVMHYIAKYMLQIYLLHTIFAAGIRIVLLKIGITQALPHLVLGIVFSFVLPVICAAIAERVRFLNIVFFPVNTMKAIFHDMTAD